jgi:hypothetical protein
MYQKFKRLCTSFDSELPLLPSLPFDELGEKDNFMLSSNILNVKMEDDFMLPRNTLAG